MVKVAASLPEKPSAFTLSRNKKYEGIWYYVRRDGRRRWIKEAELLPTDSKLRKWKHYPSPPHA